MVKVVKNGMSGTHFEFNFDHENLLRKSFQKSQEKEKDNVVKTLLINDYLLISTLLLELEKL